MSTLILQTKENNPTLRKKSLKIKEINDDIRKLAKEMIETMHRNNGVGLAACQIGKGIRLFVLPEELCEKQIFINPEIIKMSKKTDIIEEGCLSLPGVFLPIKRAKSLKIKAIDENNKEFKLKAKTPLARVIQHEMDHIDGILITDKYEQN